MLSQLMVVIFFQFQTKKTAKKPWPLLFLIIVYLLQQSCPNQKSVCLCVVCCILNLRNNEIKIMKFKLCFSKLFSKKCCWNYRTLRMQLFSGISYEILGFLDLNLKRRKIHLTNKIAIYYVTTFSKRCTFMYQYWNHSFNNKL